MYKLGTVSTVNCRIMESSFYALVCPPLRWALPLPSPILI